MREKIKQVARNFSLRHYLFGVMITIILLVTVSLVTVTYLQTEEAVQELDLFLQSLTELNIRERIALINSGLALYDSGPDARIKGAFGTFLAAYNRSGGDISRIDYTAVQEQVSRNLSGRADLYVINGSGIILASTVPDVLYLNLSQNPDYQKRIPEIINGTGFVADRVVRSYSSASDPELTGIFRKFAFIPVPDHRYLLEIGVSDLSDDQARDNLSYSLISDQLDDLNPYLDEIRIFDIHRNLFVRDGVVPPGSLDPVTLSRLDEVIASRSDATFLRGPSLDGGPGRVRYLFINLSDPGSVSDMSVIAELTYSDSLREAILSRISVFYFLVAAGAVLMGLLLSFWASRFLTRPISDIVGDVDMIARGDLDHQIRSMDVREFSRLEQSITLMIRRIRAATEEIQQRKTELSIAAEIQQSFLPSRIPAIPGLDIAARTLPVKEVGGDFYDIIPFSGAMGEEQRYGVLIADVSGKGVPAALFMALCRTIIRVTVKDSVNAADALFEANRSISADSVTGMFVSVFYGLITEGISTITCVNAGHNPPVVFRNEGRQVSLLSEGGMVLGVDASFRFEEEETDLHPGDILVLYTDGVTEANNHNGEMYGTDRLVQTLSSHAGLTAAGILDAIITDLFSFTGEEEQFDDITLLVIKRTGI